MRDIRPTITAAMPPSASRTTTPAAGGADPIVLDFNSGPNAYVNSYTSTLITAPVIPADYYAVPLTAGELTTIAVKGTGGSADARPV